MVFCSCVIRHNGWGGTYDYKDDQFMLMPISFSTLHAHQRFHFHFRIITDCGSRIYAARPVWEAEPLVLPVLMLTMMMVMMVMMMVIMVMMVMLTMMMVMMTICDGTFMSL